MSIRFKQNEDGSWAAYKIEGKGRAEKGKTSPSVGTKNDQPDKPKPGRAKTKQGGE